MFEKFRTIFFLVQKKFVKYLESWKKHGCIFFLKFRKCLDSRKRQLWNFHRNLGKKKIVTIISMIGVIMIIISMIFQPPFLLETASPTPLTKASAPRAWMKDIWLKFESTCSRVLLVNVSESGLISEFLTFSWSDF